MKICKTVKEVRNTLQNSRSKGQSIGFVPTMGALHQGHLKLVEASKENCDLTVTSIFVNPTQFNNADDLSNYPKTIDEDSEKLMTTGCDILFLPDVKEMYLSKPQLRIGFDGIAEQLEGSFRPGHFDGVGLVVSKLFNIIQPDQAFFGQKDLQQFFIVKALVDHLNYSIQLRMVPTVRESNGLAMSSRNMRLSEKERKEAGLIYKALGIGQKSLLNSSDIQAVKKEVKELFDTSERLGLEYFEIISTDDFKPTESLFNKEKIALCIAVNIGQVRLIDNLMLIS
ncbi:pantoate--beta-alanine ligase [Roseivirga sp. E12]|uniref:pantoate--beta-alanine ligase n=1 Tax=Roseivirga sp. E12 TaxID=2819237 RepID=UPI001ABC0AFA|nr:pantoate--beta-alanine ligase [Roseivirga sp. E12]MBO3699437.1 pantoate--beta-alanine ligase [Roseivirga sp. E12]